MNTFTAYYENMDTGENIARTIQFDFIDVPEKEIFKYAIEKAYELKQSNECFYMLENLSLI